MKKILILALVVVMLVSMAVPAFAENPEIKLTITNPASTNISIKGSTIDAYKLFDVTFGEDGSIAYFLADKFNNDDAKTIMSRYFDFVLNLDGNYNAVPNEDCTPENAMDMAKYFVEEDLIGKADPTGPDASATGGEDETAVLDLTTSGKGYYLITASGKSASGETVKSALMMQTIIETASKNIKASVPKLDKTIEKNGTSSHANSFNIGETVNFKLTSDLPEMIGYEYYELWVLDTLSEGLTPPASVDDITVLVDGAAPNAENVGLDVAIDGQNITVKFIKGINLKGSKQVVVTYSAVLNEKAIDTACETNTAKLKFSNDPYDPSKFGFSPDVVDDVYNFDLVLDKYISNPDDENDTAAKLKDAQFVLYRMDGGVKKYYKYDTTAGKVTWNAKPDDDTVMLEDYADIKTTDENGAASFKGLAAGSYKLSEVQAPVGYNMLVSDVDVTIIADYKDNGEIDLSTNDHPTNTNVALSSGRWVHTQSIANKKGAVLPSTGGIGTTLFYVIGCLLVLSSGVVLVTKRRMKDKK